MRYIVSVFSIFLFAKRHVCMVSFCALRIGVARRNAVFYDRAFAYSPSSHRILVMVVHTPKSMLPNSRVAWAKRRYVVVMLL